MHSRRVIGLGGSFGLAAALALACAPAVVAETEAEAHKRLKASQPKIGGEWATKPAHQPKKGKPTKAEKKAAKRARALPSPIPHPLPAQANDGGEHG